jgi:hypothetical protein
MKTAEPRTEHGRCHDCASGTIINPANKEYGFAQFVDADGPQHWYCCYCGSNHVDILDEEGNVIVEQGDLYEFDDE